MTHEKDKVPGYATALYTAPFIVFVAVMAMERAAALPPGWFYPVRVALVATVLGLFSWRVVSLRPTAPLASAVVGIIVFVIWVGPDIAFGPGYRHHWIFENSLMGAAASSAPESLKRNVAFILVRVLGCVAVVPVIEELFWRGWLMRWFAGHNFLAVPLGSYKPFAFWAVAVLFASEHGPYWEVGLAAGIIYNWWIVRTKSLADCIEAHAVTNGLLSIYVLLTGQWQYWL